MKLFECMATGNPVVAADTPAIKDHVSENEIVFYTTDDGTSLAARIREILEDRERFADHTKRAYTVALAHSWQARARRILALIYGD